MERPMTASQTPDCKLPITCGSHRREPTARHDRPDSGSTSAGASRMESGEPAPSGNAIGSANSRSQPEEHSDFSSPREHPTGGEGQAQYHRFVVLGTNRSLPVY